MSLLIPAPDFIFSLSILPEINQFQFLSDSFMKNSFYEQYQSNRAHTTNF